MMGIPGPVRKFSVERGSAGAYVNGAFVPGATTTLVVLGSVQPLNGRELENLPEGQRVKESIKIYTATELKTVDEVNQIKADVVIDGGKRYEVQTVDRHSMSLGSHFKVTAFKE